MILTPQHFTPIIQLLPKILDINSLLTNIEYDSVYIKGYSHIHVTILFHIRRTIFL